MRSCGGLKELGRCRDNHKLLADDADEEFSSEYLHFLVSLGGVLEKMPPRDSVQSSCETSMLPWATTEKPGAGDRKECPD